MIPRSEDPSGVANATLAKLIVRYRDFDDGIPRTANFPPQGHGPFTSLMELNRVFDPTSKQGNGTYSRTFQNGLGLMPQTKNDPAYNNDPTYFHWGNYAPGPTFVDNKGKAIGAVANKPLPEDDWVPQTLMVRRISNMVTLRSDSFTAYVIVQGWRNAGTSWPELVVEKRTAFTLDRTAIGASGSGNTADIKTYSIPAD
jgi:hypothetical protein